MKKQDIKVITGKRVMVTGGTGSFGRMFIHEILHYDPSEIVIFSRDEDKQGAMRLEIRDKRLRFVLGDVRDLRSVKEAMRGVDYVIHAAALKWITEVEYNVWEGIKTNVIGAQNLIEAARDNHVEKVIALSTDKAVEPINAYGMTKALQERLMTTANLYDNGTITKFISTRYGNVVGSRGSVVPLFRSLIDAGKPLTITDPAMTRFIMTLEDSVDLVLQALTEGVGGEVFVRKMPAHTIQDLVDVMLKDVAVARRKVQTIGVRPGEKIHEVLVSSAESVRTADMGEYYVVLPQISIAAIRRKYGKTSPHKPFVYASNTVRRIPKKELQTLIQKEGWLS